MCALIVALTTTHLSKWLTEAGGWECVGILQEERLCLADKLLNWSSLGHLCDPLSLSLCCPSPIQTAFNTGPHHLSFKSAEHSSRLQGQLKAADNWWQPWLFCFKHRPKTKCEATPDGHSVLLPVLLINNYCNYLMLVQQAKYWYQWSTCAASYWWKKLHSSACVLMLLELVNTLVLYV